MFGDFNVHLERPVDSAKIEFRELLKSFDMVQYIYEVTHNLEGWLNLVITP